MCQYTQLTHQAVHVTGQWPFLKGPDSSFGLTVQTVSLYRVRHHPSTRSRKISPFPAWGGFCYGPSDWVPVWVQLHFNWL